MIQYGPVYVNNITEDFDTIQMVYHKDFSNILTKDAVMAHPLAGIDKLKTLLDPRVSMGAVINLFTPNPDFTPEHNAYIQTVPTYRRELMAVIKQLYKTEWKDDWRQHFYTDAVNGALSHELKYRGSPVISSTIRVGHRSVHDANVPIVNAETADLNSAWKTFTLRQDFFPCSKLQTGKISEMSAL